MRLCGFTLQDQGKGDGRLNYRCQARRRWQGSSRSLAMWHWRYWSRDFPSGLQSSTIRGMHYQVRGKQAASDLPLPHPVFFFLPARLPWFHA